MPGSAVTFERLSQDIAQAFYDLNPPTLELAEGYRRVRFKKGVKCLEASLKELGVLSV